MAGSKGATGFTERAVNYGKKLTTRAPLYKEKPNSVNLNRAGFALKTHQEFTSNIHPLISSVIRKNTKSAGAGG
ncbi:MAG: hypothetical protein ACE5EB_04845 [Thermodesulfobacteriota bacterium]